MSRCPDCSAHIEGLWVRCPLCRATLEGERGLGPEAFPAAPLRFQRRELRRVLVALSLLLVVLSFGSQLLFPNLIAPVRTVWLSIAVLWLVALAVVQRRRNVGGLVAWLLVLLSLSVFLWNQFEGPEMWATTWAIPAICAAANITLAIVVWLVSQDASEHLAKTALVLLIGMMPGLFVVFGWVVNPWPALASAALSVALLAVMVSLRPRQLFSALQRRLHI